MSRFGPRPEEFFGQVYQDVAPWDIGGAQPALMELLHERSPEGPILDVGCGSGDLAIALVQQGHDVLGIDFVSAAIEQARTRAAALPEDERRRLELRVADALHPSLLGQEFGAVVDSGFLHLFDDAQVVDFVRELSQVLRTGGRYYLLAFAVTFPIPHSPRAVSEAHLREWFTPERGWRILECRPAEFQSRIAPVPSIRACVERVSE